MSEFDYRKPVETKRGHPARLIDETAHGEFPLTYLVELFRGSETPLSYTETGKCGCGAGKYDLVNFPETYECWVVFDDSGMILTYRNDDHPDFNEWRGSSSKCLAVKHVVAKKGETE